jgi:hypothetical protein
VTVGLRRIILLLSVLTVVALTALPNDQAFADDEPLPLIIPQSSQNPAAPAQAPKGSQDQTSQSGANQSQSQSGQSETQSNKKNSDRVFFIMPNFLTVQNEANVKPLRSKEKFALVAKGVFDPYEFTTVGILAGIRQAENAYPGFGQGVSGYAKRYGTAMADQVDGNFMVGAIYPSILRTDPRYFELGQGKFMHRVGYAISRLFITRKDSGGQTFNLSESLGNGTAIAISNLYYPSSDRGVTSSISDWGVQMGIDAVGNELKEFWPDIHRHFARKKQGATPAASDH